MHKKIPESYSNRADLPSQQWMVVYYPNTVWKKGYAKHDVTGKTCDIKKGEKGICHQVKVEDFSNQHPMGNVSM